MADVKQQTKLTLRQRQAQLTRELIINAARDLFIENGYTGTTMEAIAEAAGVAVSTVYAVFASKRGILRAIREGWHTRSQIREVAYSSAGEISPAERLNQLAQATRRQWQAGAEVMAIYKGAAAADPEAAAELDEALDGRRHGITAFAASLADHLRPGLTAETAAALLQALCLPEVYQELVSHSGWTPEAYEAWLAGALRRELLGVKS